MTRLKSFVLFPLIILLLIGCRKAKEEQPKPVVPVSTGKIEAKLTYLEGEVSLTRNNVRLPAEQDVTLLPGDTIETGKDAQAEVTFDDSSTINLDPETRFGISELVKDSASGQRTVKTDLLSGELKARITKLAQNSTFEIESPTAVSAVRGTEFVVAYKEGQPTQVTVLSGKVGVRRPGKREAEVFIQEHERLFIRLAERPGRPFRLAAGDEDLIRAKWRRWQERRTRLMERLRPRRAIFGPEMPRGLGPGMGRGRVAPPGRGAVVPRRGAVRKPALRKPGALKRRARRTPKSKNPRGKKPGARRSRRSR